MTEMSEGLLTSSLNTPPSSWNLAATKSSSSIWCSPAEKQRVTVLKDHKTVMLLFGFRTGVSAGIKHVVQNGVVVHVKPVGDVSQPVWATEGRPVKNKTKHRWIGVYFKIQIKFVTLAVRIQGVLCVNEDDFSSGVSFLPWQLSSDFMHKYLCYSQETVLKILFTHHRACERAEFFLCGTLIKQSKYSVFNKWNIFVHLKATFGWIKRKVEVCSPPKASVIAMLSMPPPKSLLQRLKKDIR